MKSIMVYREVFREEYNVYQLNDEGTFFCGIRDPKFGFDMQTVIDNMNGFHFFDSLADANMFIRECKFGMVDPENADIFCPKCNRGYDGRDESEYNHVWNYVKECACGHKMKVQGSQSITYTVSPE